MKYVMQQIISSLLMLVIMATHAWAQETTPLKIKALDQSNYTRLVFYPAEKNDFNAKLDKNALHVGFKNNPQIDLSGVVSILGTTVDSVAKSQDQSVLTFELDAENYVLRTFSGDNFVGVDLLPKHSLAAKKLAKQKAIAKNKAPLPKLKKIFEPAAIDYSAPFNVAQAVVPTLATNTPNNIPPSEQENVAVTEPESNLENASTIAAPVDATNSDNTQAETAANTEPNEAGASSEVLQADSETTDEAQPINEVAEQEDTITDDVSTTSAESTDTQNNDNQLSNLDPVIQEKLNTPYNRALTRLKQMPKEFTIPFNFDDEVGAALFKRAGYVWIVFDSFKDVDTNAIEQKHDEVFVSVRQINNPHYTIIHAKLASDDADFVIYQEDDKWLLSHVTFQHDVLLPTEVSIQMSELHGSSTVLDTPLKKDPVRLIDPEVGDELLIVTQSQIGRAMDVERRFVDYVILPSVQGFAFQLRSDDIEVKKGRASFALVGVANRLAGSAQSALREIKERERLAKLREKKKLEKSDGFALLKYRSWAGNPQKSYFSEFVRFQDEVTRVNWQDKSDKRMDVARFYFVNGLATEAYGVLKVIEQVDPDYTSSNDYNILKGASLYLMGRYQDAVKSFERIDTEQLKEDGYLEEATFWAMANQLQIDKQIKMDKFLSRNPIKSQKKDKSEILDSGDTVEITKLIYDTSNRLINMIRRMDAEFATSEEIEILESTARFVADHYQESIKRFEETEMFKSGDIFQAEENNLWWGVSNSSAAQTAQGQLLFLENRDSFLRIYPDQIFNDFALVALEDRIQKNDLGAAEEILQSFKPNDDRERFINNVRFLTGLFYAKDEEPEKAVAMWELLKDQASDPYNRSRATFALTSYRLQRREIEVPEAIKEFNNVRMAWRGDVLELNTLKLLGQFYFDQKQYMEGFKVWREIVAAFPGTEEALLIAKRMSERFVQIFTKEDNEQIDQLAALTLFYEFRELTPIGKLGDEMINRLADRLIEVDLLERAAALLTHQVRFRLIGNDRDVAAIKLINIHLKNRRPQLALDVLNVTENPKADPLIIEERKYLKATTLTQLGKSNRALAVLERDDSHLASFLRADVYWRRKVWKKVVDELQNTFRELRREERLLSPEEGEQLLRLAVAYALLERKKRLQILYEDFIEYLPGDQRKNLLTFVALDRGPVDFRDLEYSVGFEDMQKFLQNYLKEKSESLEEANALGSNENTG